MKTKILVIALMLIGFISSAQKKPSEWSSATKDAVRTAINLDSVFTAKTDSNVYYTATEVDRKAVFTMKHSHHTTQNPSDGETMYVGSFENAGSTLTSDGSRSTSIPINGRIVAVTCSFRASNAASTETFSVYARIDETTDSLITSQAVFTGAYDVSVIHATNLDIPLTSSNLFETKVVFPTFATNPTGVLMEFYYYIQFD